MMRLYLTDAKGVSRMHSLKALREALRVIDSEATIKQADELLDQLEVMGYAHMATGDPVTLARMTSMLSEVGMVAKAVPEADADDQERRWRARHATRNGATPEEVFKSEAPGDVADDEAPFSPAAYETAMVCMAITNGDPLRAACHAHALARTTGDAVVFHEVIHIIGAVFPWNVRPLREAGMWPE